MCALRHFYPRPPRGGRPTRIYAFLAHLKISIHALREEGDLLGGTLPQSKAISIHALREEGDSNSSACIIIGCDFYPRPPRGGRRPA